MLAATMLHKMPKKSSIAGMIELDLARKQFREELVSAKRPAEFYSRIGVVLSGGGAKGAYEAGVLMAFEDAVIPTHIISATSIGSINAASYAGDSTGFVGKADNTVRAWMDLTPAILGIDWSRYIFLLAGLVAASAGIGNFLWGWFADQGIYLHAHHPRFTWFSLAAAGVGILFFADKLSYIGYLLLNMVRGRRFQPDRRKAAISVLANLMVWGFVINFLAFTHLHVPLKGKTIVDLWAPLPLLAAIFFCWVFWKLFRGRLSQISHRFLRLPLRTGLFANFERTKFLRTRISEPGLRNSPIRVLMTATDLHTGAVRFFSNTQPDELLHDPCVSKEFVRNQVECPRDLVQAAVASSAYTFAFEAVPMGDQLWTDGGIVSNQPISPAIRMGADVLFLVLVQPLDADMTTGPVKTFLDVGVHAWDILISKNFKTDIALLNNFNRLCCIYAEELGVRPEQLELQIGEQHYRYVKPFSIAPEQPLPVTVLDFDAELLAPVIVQGYRDATRVLKEFLAYEAARPPQNTRRVVRLAAEKLAAAAIPF